MGIRALRRLTAAAATLRRAAHRGRWGGIFGCQGDFMVGKGFWGLEFIGLRVQGLGLA